MVLCFITFSSVGGVVSVSTSHRIYVVTMSVLLQLCAYCLMQVCVVSESVCKWTDPTLPRSKGSNCSLFPVIKTLSEKLTTSERQGETKEGKERDRV